MPRTWEPITNKDIPWTEKTLKEQYNPNLIKLMRFKDGIHYELDNDFTNEELGSITPAIVVRWVCIKVYGSPDPNPNNNPTQGCS